MCFTDTGLGKNSFSFFLSLLCLYFSTIRCLLPSHTAYNHTYQISQNEGLTGSHPSNKYVAENESELASADYKADFYGKSADCAGTLVL